MKQVYEDIGVGYVGARSPDPRIARSILLALGDARMAVNVGAGTGNYEPVNRQVVAVSRPGRCWPSVRQIRIL